ncbi:MAG: Npt1/Npt2 family nucleotide transporter [Candidatus Poribacteria bacterium]|nr:Npt1/Npt2 family nucleotide transporter [Candidatus Poribacteria bacterium]
MPKKNTIATILNLQPEENRLVRLMLIHSFFIGIAQVFTATVASTLFLSEFDASMLPYTYIGVAVFVTLIGFIYAKLHAYLPFSTLLIVNLSAMFVSLFGFRLLLLFDSQWVVLAFYIWSYVVWIALNIEFWGLAGRIFTIRQGKRLFGLIGSGEVVSIILGGFSASALVKFVGTPNLLLVSASGIGLSLILLTYITRAYADGLLLPEEETKKPRAGKEEVRESLSNLIQNRYVMLIFGLSALSWFACYFVHNILYDRAGDRYTHENQLAAFFGTFYAVIGFVTLLSRIFITDRLMNRHGLKVGLLVLPVMIVAGAASFAIIGAMFGMIPIIFWLIAATRLFDKVCRDSVNRSSLMVLYQPLPADQRLRVQMMVESMADPIAAGVAGIALLFLTNVLSFGIIQLSYGLLCILSVWIMVAIMLQREYRTVLTNALAKRTLSGMALSLNDGSSVAVLQRRLQSPHAGEVIHALNMLKEIEHESLETFLIDLLEHPASEVRQDVLRSIEQLGVVTALEAVAKRVELEESSQVRGVALRTFAALGGALEQVLPYLEHSDPHIKLGAAVGLLRSGGIQGVLLAGADLLEQVTSADPVNRKHAAQVLGEVGVRDFYHPLLDLLKDDNLQVRQEALAAVEKLKNPQLWPLVVDNLSVPAVRTATVSALVAGGESALPVLEAAFAKKGQQRDVRIRIVRIFGQIRGDRAVQLLYDKISVPDREISYQALLSLSLCNYHVRDEDISIIEGRIEEEAAWAAWTLSALRDIKIDPTTTLLKTALENTFEQSRKRIFLLLAFIYDSESILRARDNLTHPSAGKRAYALEVIDNLISQKLKGLLFPLLDNLPLNQRLEHLNRTFPQETVDANRRLADIVNQAEKWGDFFLEACALYAIGKCGTVASIDTILSALSHPKPLVRETAAWALSQLDSTTFHEYLPQLKNDSSPHVADVVCRLDTAQDKDQLMFLNI